MINLIPSAAKKSLKFEYWVRVFSVWLIIWSVALLVGVTLMFPTYVLIGSQVSATAEEAESAEENVRTFAAVSEQLIRSSQQARFIVDENKQPKLSEYQSLLKQYENQEVRVEGVDIKRQESGIAPIIVTGIATDRQAYADFRERLLANEAIQQVEFDISNLAQDRDIEFSLTVEINNEVDI